MRLNELLAPKGGFVDAEKAYENFRNTVRREAFKLRRPLEVSQSALWVKAIAVEAFDGKADGCKTAGSALNAELEGKR